MIARATHQALQVMEGRGLQKLKVKVVQRDPLKSEKHFHTQLMGKIYPIVVQRLK